MLGKSLRPAKGAAAVIGAQPARCSLAPSSIDYWIALKEIELTVGGLTVPDLVLSFLQFLANSLTSRSPGDMFDRDASHRWSG